MKALKAAKILNILSYVGIIGVVVYYFFVGFKRFEDAAFALLAVCILRMLSSGVKASFYEKEYTRLKDENLPPAEDIKKVERRVASNEKKIEKTSNKLPKKVE